MAFSSEVETGSREENASNWNLGFAGVRVQEAGSRAAPGHLVFQLFKTLVRRALTIVDELDRGLPVHRTADQRVRILPKRLVDKILAVLLADGPFEADRSHWPWTDLGVAVPLWRLGNIRDEGRRRG